ncbi:MAG: M3 family metallopeptidase [Opitutaceae bacterium]|jgi:peptidyl-dipeptidase Dcp
MINLTQLASPALVLLAGISSVFGSEANPLMKSWSGPFGGVPPFNEVKLEDFKPAFEEAMKSDLAEIDAITANPAAPSFENTIAALENCGRPFTNLNVLFGVWSQNLSTPEFQAIEREMAPRIAEFSDKIYQNEKLFRRIEAVYNSPEKARLSPEQQRLVWYVTNNFIRQGARLDAEAKQRVGEINQRLASLTTQFSANVLADESDYVLYLKSGDLDGLPEALRASAVSAAAERNHKGEFAILNTRSSMEPFLTYSIRRDLREKVWRTYYSRGDNGDAKDNKNIIAEILKLRAKRAKILGYPTHAHWRLEDQMAKTPERAMALMEAVWKPAVARVHEEVADMQAIANKEKAGIAIAPWDYRFYAEKVRKARYDIDENEVKPYLQLDKLREAMFWVAGELFDFSFTPVSGLPVFHPDMVTYEVRNRTTGQHIGLWYFDPYARTGKHSGAWMNAYRNQERFAGEITTIVSNNANFIKGRPGQPVLISWDDATTLFHEFGHALHGLCSNVSYPSLSGTSVARDFVEFPSQLLEHWLSTPEVLNRFALHYQTGKPMPKELLEKINRASKFNEGFQTVEYLAAALIDMKLHMAGDVDIDPAAFERDELARLGMPKEIVMRHRTPQFSHIFSGDEYSAGYYSYLWADTLTADAYEAFTEAKGPYDKDVAAKLLKCIFSIGNTMDPAEAYRAFRGRDPGIDALMRKRGFPVPEKK